MTSDTDKTYEESIQKIADYYGMDAQLDILQEECAELIQAISKYRRINKLPGFDSQAYSDLIEEMTDVKIMLDQIEYLLDSPIAFDIWRKQKIARQLERIKDEQIDAIKG